MSTGKQKTTSVLRDQETKIKKRNVAYHFLLTWKHGLFKNNEKKKNQFHATIGREQTQLSEL